MSLDEFLSRLDPKTAARLKTAKDIDTQRLQLASVGLTQALVGGIGRGRITLIYGNTSSGKSMLAMQSVGKWQKQGLVCALVDAEGTYDEKFGEKLGVDNNELIYIESKSSGRIEREITPLLTGGIDVIVIDSVSDIMPEVFIDKNGEMVGERKQVGAQAKAITGLLNAIHYLNERTAVVVISQTTTEFSQTYVKQIPHGGKKMEFASSQIVRLTSSNSVSNQKMGKIMLGGRLIERPVAREVTATVEKNKIGPQGGSVKYDIYYAGDFVGIDYTGEIVDLAETLGLLQRSGAWYTVVSSGDRIQGRDRLIAFFRDNPEKHAALVTEVEDVLQ